MIRVWHFNHKDRDSGHDDLSLPAGGVQAGDNTITIRLVQESWIIYDYVALRDKAEPLPLVTPADPNLLAELRQGPLAGVDEIVFAVRRLGEDPHWYANFGSTLDHSRWRTYLDGGRLCCLICERSKYGAGR